MSKCKYYPLNVHLKFLSLRHVTLFFYEIEQILGFELPKSKMYPAWWSNNPTNNTMTHQWLDAGYMTEAVNVVSERLTFRRRDRFSGVAQ